MWMRSTAALVTALVIGSSSAALAEVNQTKKHRAATHVVQKVRQPVVPLSYYGGRLVNHPAHNIACNTPESGSRWLPCDQSAWVYGSPCEVDMGSRRTRPCD